MFSLRSYERCSSVARVLELLDSQESCVILGGNHWLKQSSRVFDKGLDLSAIEHYQDIQQLPNGSLKIGAGVSYGELEDHPWVQQWLSGVLSYALKGIVGKQLRNTACLGASIYSRFAFSDSLPVLLAADAQLELARQGYISLAEFLKLPASQLKKDFLLSCTLDKKDGYAAYKAIRITANDFPLLCAALVYDERGFSCAFGARPGLAQVSNALSSFLYQNLIQGNQLISPDYFQEINTPQFQDSLLDTLQEDMSFGSSAGAEKAYRLSLASRMLPQLIYEVLQRNEEGKLNAV